MSAIKPSRSDLLTDEDVEYSFFDCCGDEDLVFLRCASCAHIWIECYECSTWYTDLADLSCTASSFVADPDDRVACPECQRRFPDFHYLMADHVDAYLATAEQVIGAGYGRFLSKLLRQRYGIDSHH